jgi:methionyl-tRNA formyltransferase
MSGSQHSESSKAKWEETVESSMVTVIFLGVNRFGREIYDWLCNREDATVLALLTEKDQLESVKKLEPDLIVSAGFRHIVPEEILSIPDLGAVNLHPSYLPYNRGASPNVWSIIEGTPAGVSVHYMTTDVDGGPIIGRRKVAKYPDDNGRDLYRRLEEEMIDLFKHVWTDIITDSVDTVTQSLDDGTYHLVQDFTDLFEIDRDERKAVGEFIDELRALTFPPYNNAYFVEDGTKYYLELSVTPESEVSSDESIHPNIPSYED